MSLDTSLKIISIGLRKKVITALIVRVPKFNVVLVGV